MVANLFPSDQIVIACVLGIIAGAAYYIAGAWLLFRRPSSIEVKPDELPIVPYRAQEPPPRNQATDEAIAKFVEELRRSAHRMEPQ